LRRAHHLTSCRFDGGHAEFIIGRAFARPGGFAHPTIFIGDGCARLRENTGGNISVFYADGVGVCASRRPWGKQYRR
jgi:hypothetical protein